jgi:hypothetical protein
MKWNENNEFICLYYINYIVLKHISDMHVCTRVCVCVCVSVSVSVCARARARARLTLYKHLLMVVNDRHLQ